MKIIRGTVLLFFAILFFSCSNRKIDLNADGLSSEKNSDAAIEQNYSDEFIRRNTNSVQMIYPLEYYKNEIEKFQEDFFNMQSVSMKINHIMNISSITKVENVVPEWLTFLVCWINPKGSVYYLYCFNEYQKIADSYFCGQTIFLIPERQILMEKLSGNIIENEVVSVGDFNKDGINEIALYTQYQNVGNAFCVHGFKLAENRMEELCVAPVFINLQEMFPSVESTGNGFKLLEVVDDESLDLAWNVYLWNDLEMKYEKDALRVIARP